MITFPCTILASIHLIRLDQHPVITVNTRSASGKASASKGSKTTPRITNKSSTGVARLRKAPEVSSKARRIRDGGFVPVTLFQGTISPQKIPETDLDAPKEVRPPIDQLKRLLAQWEDGRNAQTKGRRVGDDQYPSCARRHIRPSPALS